MSFPFIQETVSELNDLERQHPLMLNRVRFFRWVKTNPSVRIEDVVDIFGLNYHEVERWARLYQFGGINLLLHPRTVLDPRARQGLKFSEYAEIRTLELFKQHDNQIGRQLWVDYQHCKNNQPSPDQYAVKCEYFNQYTDFEANHKNWYRTDCQTYILDVLRYAFEKIGRKDLYTGLSAAFKREGTTGTVMAKYLVKNEWRAYFFMPDTVNPNDGDEEHTKKYENALKTKNWWGVPITDFVVNYRPTTQMRSNAKVHPGERIEPIKVDSNGYSNLHTLESALFGVCVFTAGIHTALFSKGMIYEVHWRGISDNVFNNPVGTGDRLFGRSSLLMYGDTAISPAGYIEGIVVVPPDVRF